MTIARREKTYEDLAGSSRENLLRLKRNLSANSFFRVAIFTAGGVAVYLLHENTAAMTAVLVCASVLFLLLLRRHATLSEQRNREEAVQKIAADELKAFRHDFSAFDGMGEKIDPAHDFSFDLDIFGNKSVCQLINRTSLKIGGEKLADFLKNPLTEKAAIIQRQQAVAELALQEKFSLNFRVTGNLSDDVFCSLHDIANALSEKCTFRNASLWKLLTSAIPCIYVIYFLLLATGSAPFFLFLPLYVTTLALSSIPMKRVKTIWTAFDQKAKTLSAYSQLLEQTEKTEFTADVLRKLQQKIAAQKPASRHIGQLARHVRNLDMAFFAPIFLVVNPLLLWNVLYALKTTSWLHRNREKALVWFSALAEMDALISLGTFAANHPDYTYPEVSDTFCFHGLQLGHPLIPHSTCVKNDIDISRKPFFLIVTGANMAGKSTYLRTVGVNHLLASIGAPAYAEKMVFFPGRLLTNLRTADSLVNNESYFFAELKRLQRIIRSLETCDHGVFIILDEILKGTNSEDKQKGSFALMKRLVKLNGNGIIATHDLALGELESEFPEEIKNFHFDADIQGNTLSFDYKLRPGIAQNMNASFLMRTMGITE